MVKQRGLNVKFYQTFWYISKIGSDQFRSCLDSYGALANQPKGHFNGSNRNNGENDCTLGLCHGVVRSTGRSEHSRSIYCTAVYLG